MSITPKPPQIIPYLFYRDVGAALDFLCPRLRLQGGNARRHAERRHAGKPPFRASS